MADARELRLILNDEIEANLGKGQSGGSEMVNAVTGLLAKGF